MHPRTHANYTLLCLTCRYVAKAMLHQADNRRCPNCRAELRNMGKNFKPPRKSDERGWRKVIDKFFTYKDSPEKQLVDVAFPRRR